MWRVSLLRTDGRESPHDVSWWSQSYQACSHASLRLRFPDQDGWTMRRRGCLGCLSGRVGCLRGSQKRGWRVTAPNPAKGNSKHGALTNLDAMENHLFKFCLPLEPISDHNGLRFTPRHSAERTSPRTRPWVAGFRVRPGMTLREHWTVHFMTACTPEVMPLKLEMP